MILGRMWLVCIDEYNAKTDREQAKIKRLLTEKDVQIRKMRSDQYTMTPRLCSFVTTTDHKRENLWRAQDIQAELSKHLKAADVRNLTVLGKALKNLKWPRGGNNGVRGYYLTIIIFPFLM